MIFQNRAEAGKLLAKKLENYCDKKPIVLGMPRGGVVVAFEVAQFLKAPLDVVVARKLGAPGQPEYAIGAIAPGDVLVFNTETQTFFSKTSPEVQKIIAEEKVEMARRIKLYRGTDKELNLKSRIVIIVDDGIATGQSALAAIRSVKKQNPARIIFAAPVGARDSVDLLKREVDEIICLETPAEFNAVGLWYHEFLQTSDEEVIDLLSREKIND